MKRLGCFLAAMAVCLLFALESRADYIDLDNGARVRVEIKRYNAPQLDAELLSWLHQVSGWDMWNYALRVKNNGGEWNWRIRFRVVSADNTTVITTASVRTGDGTLYPLTQSGDEWIHAEYRDSDTILLSEFVGNVTFDVTTTRGVSSAPVTVPAWTGLDIPDIEAARVNDESITVTVNDPAVTRAYIAGAWYYNNPFVLVDEQEFHMSTAPNPNTITLTDTTRGGFDPERTYAFETEGVNDSVGTPNGMSYRTTLFGILREGQEYLDPEAPSIDDPVPGDPGNSGSSGSSGGGCLMNPAAGLALDMLLPLMAALGLLARRFRH